MLPKDKYLFYVNLGIFLQLRLFFIESRGISSSDMIFNVTWIPGARPCSVTQLLGVTSVDCCRVRRAGYNYSYDKITQLKSVLPSMITLCLIILKKYKFNLIIWSLKCKTILPVSELEKQFHRFLYLA